jgi:hypothetical protein
MAMSRIDVKLTREGPPSVYNKGYVHCAMRRMIFRHFQHFYHVEFSFESGKDPRASFSVFILGNPPGTWFVVAWSAKNRHRLLAGLLVYLRLVFDPVKALEPIECCRQLVLYPYRIHPNSGACPNSGAPPSFSQ